MIHSYFLLICVSLQITMESEIEDTSMYLTYTV